MCYLTLSEASEKWGLSEKTIIKYVIEGRIGNIKVEDNILLFPPIRKPHYVKKSSKSLSKEIIRATMKKEYIDRRLAVSEKAEFKSIMNNLLSEGYLICSSPKTDYLSNNDMTVTAKGEEWMKHGFKVEARFNPTVTIKNTNNIQIGGINTMINR